MSFVFGLNIQVDIYYGNPVLWLIQQDFVLYFAIIEILLLICERVKDQ